jgi:hypothetical protein
VRRSSGRRGWLWLSLWAGAFALVAQRPALAQPDLRPSSPPQLAPITASNPLAPHYWIVSTRHCGRPLHECPQCHFSVHHFDQSGRQSVSSIDELVSQLQPGTPVCIVVHGSFVDWESVCNDSSGTYRWLRRACPGRPVHVVFFTWPSDDTAKVFLPVDIAVLGRRAASHGLYLSELTTLIPNEHPVCLLGHSHGARMVVSTLHLLAGGAVDGVAFGGGRYHQHRIRAVLAAAAFDHHWLNPGQRYERAVERPEVIVNLLSRRDFALGFYRFRHPFSAAPVARTGLTDFDRQQIGPFQGKFQELDVTSLVGLGHVWPHYYSEPAIARAITPYVFFTDLDPEMLSSTRDSTRSEKWSSAASPR